MPALLRDYQGIMVVDKPFVRPYVLGGNGIGGLPLDSHDDRWEVREVFNGFEEIQRNFEFENLKCFFLGEVGG